MAREIERKFLVTGDAWRDQVIQQTRFVQGYLNSIEETSCKSSVRIRIEGTQANINIKSLEIGLSRDEYEYPISLGDAENMLKKLTVGPIIEKTRYLVPAAIGVWEIDEFFGDNAGLIIAELELPDERTPVTVPDWIGREVTDDLKYYNVSLSKNPYSQWKQHEAN